MVTLWCYLSVRNDKAVKIGLNGMKYSAHKLWWIGRNENYLSQHSENDLAESTKFSLVQLWNFVITSYLTFLVDPTKYLDDSTNDLWHKTFWILEIEVNNIITDCITVDANSRIEIH